LKVASTATTTKRVVGRSWKSVNRISRASKYLAPFFLRSPSPHMPSNTLSLRQITQILGISHSTLSLWRRGKRSLRQDLQAKYRSLVTTNCDNSKGLVHVGIQQNTQVEPNKIVPRGGLEPPAHGFSILTCGVVGHHCASLNLY
jgi:hypothetical protein